MNVLVVYDTSWDNFAEISRRLTSKNIDPNHRINIFYGKQSKHLCAVCNKNMLQIYRRCINEKSFLEDLRIQLKFTKFCIIFHNFVEHNTISSIIIKLCEENDIPHFIFSEHTDDFFFDGEIAKDKFRKCVLNVKDLTDREEIRCNLDFDISFPTEINGTKDYSQVIHKLRNSYKTIDENKAKGGTIFIDTKTPKQLSYLQYVANKKKWMKEVIPR